MYLTPFAQSVAGRKCVIYADEQPQVLLIQPVGEHENATLDAEIEAIKEAVHVPFVFAGFAISDWEDITKNKAIAQVGNNICWEYDHLQRAIGSDYCTLVWEKGGHFVTPHLRLARAFAWCVNSLMK